MKGPQAGFTGHVITAVVGCLAAAAIFIGFLAVGGGLRVGDRYKVRAVVPTAAQLTPSSRVTMAGAQVGRIADVRRQGYTTVVEMEIDDDRVTPIPADSRVTVRQRTPVGESYLAITPGSSPEKLPSDGVLPARQSDEYVDVDQILSVLQGRTRQRARQLIRGTGGALEGRGEQLNELVGGGAATLQSGARVFSLLSDDREHVASLVDRLGRVAAAVGERGAAVETIGRQGLRSLRAIAARDEALRQTLEELPPTLRQVKSTSNELSTVTGTASPVVRNLSSALRELQPAVERLRPAAQIGRETLRELDGAAPRLEGTLDRLRDLSGPLTKALPEVKQTFCDVNPMIRYLKPYTDDAIMSLVGLGSASNSYDALGHLIRLSPIVGENSLAGAPEEVTLAAHQLMRSGFLAKSHGLTWNPYPKPDRIGKDGAGEGNTISGPDALRESGYKFPRVLADC
jgi:phospholipid/cholesterol/gamma-HCH transport system substrate-binding protein